MFCGVPSWAVTSRVLGKAMLCVSKLQQIIYHKDPPVSMSDSVRWEVKWASFRPDWAAEIPAEKGPTSFTKASVADLTKPLLFGAADRGPQGENLKDFNNTSNPNLHDGLFLSLLSSNGGLCGCQCGHARIKEKISLCPHIIAHMAPTPTGIIAWNFPGPESHHQRDVFPCVLAIKVPKHRSGNRSHTWLLCAEATVSLHSCENPGPGQIPYMRSYTAYEHTEKQS